VPPNPDVSAAQDPAAATYGVELGVKFKSDLVGWISAIRFYKGDTANGGTHVGHLWTVSGTLLATATFTNETASGWQQVNLPTPIQVSPGVTYVASYLDPQGHYAGNNGGFTTSVDLPPLHALSDSAAGGNGVFAYQPTFGPGGFPTSTYKATNYWVDVVLSRQPTTLHASPGKAHPGLFTSQLDVKATLTGGPSNTPLAGQTIAFTTDEDQVQVCTAVTDATGVAACSGRVDGGILSIILNNGYKATFAGTPPLAPSSDTAPVFLDLL
jgi:hypothetical protein